MQPVVRVSIIRCAPERYAELRQMMIDVEQALRPGIEAMRGFLDFHAGEDEATSSFCNVSLWESLEAAKQLDHFQPMLDAGKDFVAHGAIFERPVMNYLPLWRAQPARG